MASTPIALERLWNHYALEEDEQRKKLWLDIFLCRAIGDPFLTTLASRRILVPQLITELKIEIGLHLLGKLIYKSLNVGL